VHKHASVSTTSIYLHSDEFKRARQMSETFAARGAANAASQSEEVVLCFD
jgi:hypothetical protein